MADGEGFSGEAQAGAEQQEAPEYTAPGSHEAWQAQMAELVAERNPGITEPAAAQAAVAAAAEIAHELAGGNEELADYLTNHPLIWELGHRAQLAESQVAQQQQQAAREPGDVWLEQIREHNGLGHRVLPFG